MLNASDILLDWYDYQELCTMCMLLSNCDCNDEQFCVAGLNTGTCFDWFLNWYHLLQFVFCRGNMLEAVYPRALWRCKALQHFVPEASNLLCWLISESQFWLTTHPIPTVWARWLAGVGGTTLVCVPIFLIGFKYHFLILRLVIKLSQCP
jgi:hypothetical protein